jgi:Bacterial capsule synthesis protein PGA_cap
MESGSTIRISAVGDIALNGGYHQLASTGKARTLAGAIAPLLADNDIAIGNLEGPLTTRAAVAPPSHFTLRGDPAYAAILRDAGFTVLSLANNHMMDYGWEGLQETCSHLDAVGIRYVGAGRNLREARQPLHLCIRGLKLAVLAYCDVSILAPVYADVDRPGIAPARPSYILEDIAATKPHSDVVIVCMHWGQEHVHYPAPKYRRLAGEMIRAGASLVIGHHPHVLQGGERIADGAVSYSLGNFTFSEELWQGQNGQGESFAMPYRLNESARRAAIWNVSVDRYGCVIQESLVPTYLGSNLLPAPDKRPQRQLEINQYRQALSTNAYGLFWAIRMIASRIRVISREIGGDNGVAARLVRMRPRHLRDMRRLLVREWEQLRGME